MYLRIYLSCTVFLDIWRWRISWLWNLGYGPLTSKFIYITKIYRPGAIFLLLTVWVYHLQTDPGLSFFRWQYGSTFIHFYIVSSGTKQHRQGKVVHYGHSRPFKVIKTGTNRKHVCDFLLVFHVSMCLSSTVSEILQVISQKSAFFAVLTHCSFVCSPCKGVFLWLRVQNLVSQN